MGCDCGPGKCTSAATANGHQQTAGAIVAHPLHTLHANTHTPAPTATGVVASMPRSTTPLAPSPMISVRYRSDRSLSLTADAAAPPPPPPAAQALWRQKDAWQQHAFTSAGPQDQDWPCNARN